MDTIAIRDATLDDAGRILEIYAYYVENTAITFEYAVPTPEAFRERMAHTLVKYPYLVAESGGRIVGYAYAGPFKGRAAYDWACELSIYLDAAERGRGLGRRLYTALEDALRRMGMQNLYACIAWPEAEDAYLTRNSADFHRHMGYETVGRFRKCACKFDRWYDMIWMEKRPGSHPTPCPAIMPYPDVRSSSTSLNEEESP